MCNIINFFRYNNYQLLSFSEKLYKIDLFASIAERFIFFNRKFDSSFSKINLMKLIGITIGLNISNFAEYQCKLSLNNLQKFLKTDQITVEVDENKRNIQNEKEDSLAKIENEKRITMELYYKFL